MDELTRLIQRSRQAPAAAAFVVDPDADPVRQLIGILAVFASAQADAIEVYRGSERAGTVDRRAAAALFEDLEMNVGAGTQFVLPGDPKDAFIALACTRPDCERRLYATFFAPDAPPSCPDHPDSGTRPVW